MGGYGVRTTDRSASDAGAPPPRAPARHGSPGRGQTAASALTNTDGAPPGQRAKRPELEDAVTVLVGEFGTLIARGLHQLLEEDDGFRVAGVNVSPTSLKGLLAERTGQVAILDEMSVANQSVVRRLRAEWPELGLLVLAHRPTRAYAVRLLACGVAACVPKDAPAAEILKAIRLAADGTHVFAACVGRSSDASSSPDLSSLTVREREVLKFLSVGDPNTTIASALYISIETVRTHVAHIYRKLGVSARAELLGIASCIANIPSWDEATRDGPMDAGY
jgi:DNA-binding NarL/FixJ family response regulator